MQSSANPSIGDVKGEYCTATNGIYIEGKSVTCANTVLYSGCSGGLNTIRGGCGQYNGIDIEGINASIFDTARGSPNREA